MVKIQSVGIPYISMHFKMKRKIIEKRKSEINLYFSLIIN